MKKAQDGLVSTDTALEALQNSIASHQKSKQSKQYVQRILLVIIQLLLLLTYKFLRIKFVADATDLPPPLRGKPLVKKQKSTSRISNGTTRSMPSSPAIGASRSPAIAPPTSVPIVCDEKTQKLQALRTPLIHLLAVRQVSAKFLSQKTCCSEDECNEVLNKVGQKHYLDQAKWNLTDKSYKELDVWAFPYPSEFERQFAIDRAVAAFDRMRISREEHIWQMLLPKDERGKGKILSKLNLHSGPLAKSTTPRIHVQAIDDSAPGGHETGNDSDKKDRLGPNDAHPMARSKSQDQITKKKVSEREAQSKRLLKNPKKTAAPKLREAPSTVKKGAKKTAVAYVNTPKSTEFVHESDEDEDMIDVENKPAASTTQPEEMKWTPKVDNKTSSGTSTKLRISEGKGSKTQKKAPAPLHKPAGSKSAAPNASISKARNKFSDSSQSSVPKTKSVSRTSPHKPSPLRSPPTNASDLDNDATFHLTSSNSSTPLATHSRIINGTTMSINARTSSQVAPKTAEIPLKRKADEIEANVNNLSGSLINGRSKPVKRHKAPILSPPPSDRSSSTATTSRSSSPPLIRSKTIEKAVHFKTYYAKYEKLHRELSDRRDRSEADVEKLFTMHKRLVTLKDEISRSSKFGSEIVLESRKMVVG